MSKERDDLAPRREGGRATLRTIAGLTGLSPSTVSLALRGGRHLRPETLRSVTEAANAVGYVPNRAGVRLRTGKTNVIALALDRADDTIDFARFLIQGIGNAIAGTPYHLNIAPGFARAFAVEPIRYILENRTADGVIVTHTSARDPRVAMLIEAGFPFVTHGRTSFRPGHPFHDFHSERFAELAMARLAEKGCRRVTLVLGRATTNNYRTMVAAYVAASRRAGIAVSVVGHASDRAAPEAMRQFGRELARARHRPDGIVCDNELRSICIITGLADEGLAPGRDVHFICKQTSDVLPALYPDVDMIEEDVVAAGEELGRLLLRRIAGESPATLQSLGAPRPHWRA